MALQITIKNATNLPRTDEGGRGKIDPYFKVNFAGQTYQTQIFQNELNPNFNETFTFNDSPAKDQLVFELYDDNQNGTSTLISQYIISSDALPTGVAALPLNRLSSNTPCGQLNIEIVHIAASKGSGRGGPQPKLVVVQQPAVAAVVVPQTKGNVVVAAPPAVVVAAPPAQKSLQITIIDGKNLPLLSSGVGRKKSGDKIDPFIKVTFGNQLYQTKIFQNELNPRFNETFTFQDPPKRDKVVFELYNNDGGAGQLIATYVLDSDKIPTGKATLPLTTPQGVACGQINLEIVHLETAPVAQVVQPQTVVVKPAPTVVVQPASTVVVQGGPQKVVVASGPVKAGPTTVVVQGPQKGRR